MIENSKPANVSANATWNPENYEWQEEAYDKLGNPIGTHKYWRENGSLFEEIVYVDGIKNENRQFHPSGNLAWEIIYHRGCLLIKSRLMADEENSDIEFGGKSDAKIMKKEYFFNDHGFMTGWKAWDNNGNLLTEEKLDLNMNGSVEQVSFGSVEEASKIWNSKGNTYYKDMNYFVDQFYIEGHPEVEYEPEDERGDMERYVIAQIEAMNKSKEFGKLRELFKPSLEPFSDQFWMASAKSIQNVVALNDVAYTTVNNTVYELKGNDITKQEGLIFIGTSADKTHLLKCYEDRIDAINTNTNEVTISVTYPTSYGNQVMDKFGGLTTAVFDNPKNLKIQDVTLAFDNTRIILTTLEGTYSISPNGFNLLFPYIEAVEDFIGQNGEENFSLNMNYNYTTISRDNKYILFTMQRGDGQAMVQTKEIIKTEGGYSLQNKKFDFSGEGFEIGHSFFDKDNNLLHPLYQHKFPYGQGGDMTYLLQLNEELINSEGNELVTDDTPTHSNSPGMIQAMTELNGDLIAATNKKYIWKNFGFDEKTKYCFLGGNIHYGKITAMDASPDQSKLYVATDFGNIVCFTFLPEGQRGEDLITNMNIKDEKRYLFLHSYEPMIW